MSPSPVPRALTIAGSDSGGGAGIQADLKTFGAFGVYGASALTGVTVQNTLGVGDVRVLDPEFVVAQIEAVCSDIGCDAAKTGMLGDAVVVEAVAEAVQRLGIVDLVLDPVMVAKGGDRLVTEEAVEVIRDALLPRARCITPNLPEAEVLTGREIRDLEGMRDAARELCDRGAGAALVKGGHLEGEPVDVLCQGDRVTEIGGERIDTRHTHGTGCTLSAAIAAGLARGRELLPAVRDAKAYLTEAIRRAPGLGAGHGPLWHHFEPPGISGTDDTA